MRVWKQIFRTVSLSVLAAMMLPAVALAAQSSSPNYQVNQVFFGSGGELQACSVNYCSKQSAGETAVGATASPNYQAQAGFNTDRQPYIEFNVSTTNVDLGSLTPNVTKTVNSSFSVKTYLAHGYVVVNASDPPTNNSYTMNALSTPTAAQAGTEQFGINLVANTDPVTFGATPTQSPDSTFGFGTVATGYNTPNLYKYVKGDIVAQSNQSSSYTNYTISYIFNISNITPGGTYVLHHNLVATSTF